MSLGELLGEPDRLAFLLLLGLVLATLGLGGWLARRGRLRSFSDEERAAGAEPVACWPYLVRLELVAALATLLVVSWWAMFLPLELGPPADPTVTPALAKAPWFFVGVQELLQYFDPWLGGVMLPLLSLLGLAALPYIDRDPRGTGRHELRPAALIALLALLGLWLVPAGVGLFLRGEHWSWGPIWRSAVLDQPVAPVMASLGERLRLGPLGGQVLGAALCLGPFLLLGLGWRMLRDRFATLGLARYLIAGSLLILLAGVGLKVVLVLALRARYLWGTPWFRI
jgi:hypothetical protein